MARDDVKTVDVGGVDCIAYVSIVYNEYVELAFHFVEVHSKSA